jgi:hypothetical protein
MVNHCPYLKGERCSVFDTYQEPAQRQQYCLDVNNCTRCPNFR